MNGLTTFLIAIFFFAMGAAIVGLIWYLKGMSRRLQGGVEPAIAQDPNLLEITRLVRNMETQELVVTMDGRNFDAPHELSPDQHHLLTFTSGVLVKWLEKPGPAAGLEAEPTQAQPETQAKVPGEGEDHSVEAMADFTPPFVAEEELKPFSTELSDVVGGVIAQPLPPVPALKSIAMQIDEVLQARLAGTPLESRGITLTDAPDRGVLVTLDGKQYNGILELPDEEVQQAIRAAVKEWETKK